MTALKLIEVKANIFHVPQTYSLAHAISSDFHATQVHGTLAWQFNVIFGRVDELRHQQISAGNVAVLEENSRFVYFLVTKNQEQDVTYEGLQSALICLREHMRNHGVFKVAMPRIGCGHDEIKWRHVRGLIQKTFQHELDVEILICEHHSPMLSALPKCVIVEMEGSIFSAQSDYSLVHSASADIAISGSIGVQFKCKFGQINELIKLNKHTGNVAVLKDQSRYIYNLITKERNHERCTYSALYYALVAMREHMLQFNVKKLAIPRLGCGIDRLDWMRVQKILQFVFANDAIEIITYSFDTQGQLDRQACNSGVVHTTNCYREGSLPRTK